MITVSEIGEHALLARLRARVGPPPPDVPIGIGDDAAVIEPPRGALDVLTTDSLIEDVHFRRAWSSPADIGYKALAVNLSDLAAMGASPRAVLLSLALPDALPVADFDALCGALIDLAHEAGAALVGGNLARSPGPLVVDVTALGAVGRRRVLTRHGGRPGHELYVTGQIGMASAGLAMLQADGPDAEREEPDEACLARYRRPTPRLRAGVVVGRNRAASACMDLSDGLADAVRQMAGASRAGAVLDAAALPVHPSSLALGAAAGGPAWAAALAGGEDYELLFAVPPRRRRSFLAAIKRSGGPAATCIGQLTAQTGVWVRDGAERRELPPGFDHFR